MLFNQNTFVAMRSLVLDWIIGSYSLAKLTQNYHRGQMKKERLSGTHPDEAGPGSYFFLCPEKKMVVKATYLTLDFYFDSRRVHL